MSIQSPSRIRFSVNSGTDFVTILGAETASVACVGDPSFGATALGSLKIKVESPHPIFIPLRHPFHCDFPSILNEIYPKPCVYKPCSVVHSDQLRRRTIKPRTKPP